MVVINYPYIPETITVHLGPPGSQAENISLPFAEYIKNVASSEIYPTWPESALRANIYAIISFALNRIYTEWYRSQGYDFDITNSTQYDQAFVPNRDIFENISQIVDEIFNSYVVRQGSIEPYFTQFCNGTTSLCDGLSQWGTVSLAQQGYIPYEILQYYYGDDINLVMDAPVLPLTESYPGLPLRLGDSGNDVKLLQLWLNRVRQNYPALPAIVPADGIFRVSTEEAVRQFQEIFYMPVTGVVDQATWYRIKRYYTAVKRLGELTSEGVSLEEATLLFPGQLQAGDQGDIVQMVQYYLNVLAYFNPTIPDAPLNGEFGPETVAAVQALQRLSALPDTGIIDRPTWNQIVRIYRGILESLPANYSESKAKIYPGYVLSEGISGQDVRDLQSYLALIGQYLPQFPSIAVDGVFGPETRDAVYAFQDAYGLQITGVVGPSTWNEIAMLYDSLIAT
ncbi:MAG: peptidoglycan-binding protein [Firmicutes bacterium]|nr:peptidoglycan-binding protein [Bacillota bacterium]